MTCMYKRNKYRLVRSFTTNVKSIYDLENQFPNNKFMDNTIQLVHKTWGSVWVVIAISSLLNLHLFLHINLQPNDPHSTGSAERGKTSER